MKHFLDLFNQIENGESNDSFLNYLDEDKWVNISTSEFVLKVKHLTIALQDMGVGHNAGVAIIAQSSPWWAMVNYAINLAGGFSVPIFSNISSSNLLYELEDAGVEFAFISLNENLKHLRKFKFKKIITKNVEMDNSISLDEAFKIGETLFTEDIWEKIKLNEDNLYSIVYTSGSTGKPKGVEITQKNIISQIMDAQNLVDLSASHKALSFLPMAHIFENMLINFYMSHNVSIYFVNDITKIKELLSSVNPHYMSVVPRLLQKIFSKVRANVDEASLIKSWIGKVALNRGLHKNPHTKDTFIDKIFHKLVYDKIRKIFGTNMRFLVSGGAKLPEELNNFFLNINLPIREGYGLTECSPVVCSNSINKYKSGTCGFALKNLKVKLSKESELLVKGDSVMRGYHKQEETTKETIIDGWLYTGDLAQIDNDGFITITGRKKELFKTSTGQYVRPIKLESLLAKSIYIDYSIIIANERAFVVSLLFIDKIADNNLKEKCKKENKSYDKIFNSAINKLIKHTNKKLDKHEKIQYFKIIKETLSIESGALTPSMKVNRGFVEGKYMDVIDSLYVEI